MRTSEQTRKTSSELGQWQLVAVRMCMRRQCACVGGRRGRVGAVATGGCTYVHAEAVCMCRRCRGAVATGGWVRLRLRVKVRGRGRVRVRFRRPQCHAIYTMHVCVMAVYVCAPSHRAQKTISLQALPERNVALTLCSSAHVWMQPCVHASVTAVCVDVVCVLPTRIHGRTLALYVVGGSLYAVRRRCVP